MKRSILIAALLLVCASVFAQSGPKIAWIESAELVNAMPEKVKADTDLARYARDFQTLIDQMMKEYQTKGQQYQDGQKSMTDAMKEVRVKEIQDLQARIESTQQSAQQKVQEKKQDLWKPIMDKAMKAINDVAKERNYDYIIDKSGGSLLYGRESDNILPYVKAKMGIK